MRFSWRRATAGASISVAVVIAAYVALFAWNPGKGRVPEWGVTFSPPHAQWLGLDWRATYAALLDDLKVRRLRLSAYWNWVEWPEGQWHFEDLDWQMAQAASRGARVTLAVGRRLPRWPECHVPPWAGALPETRQREAVLAYIRAVVERYRGHPALVEWQVENEPLLTLFGECPPPDLAFLTREVALVRELDPAHPVLITDSGELSTWMRTVAVGDSLGTTMYRVVWNPILGYLRYDHLIPPALYRVKAFLAGKSIGHMVVAELQAEPWIPGGALMDATLAEQRRSMDAAQFRRNVDAARATGFHEVFLWGGEYWYWLKERKNDPTLWEAARPIFASRSMR
jgi:hypothetical protein